MASLDSFKARRKLTVGNKTYVYFSLKAAEKNGLTGISRLPNSLKILLENLLRHEDGRTVTVKDIRAVANWLKTRSSDREIAYRPARVLMQDFTGVPAVVDLAAMRDAMRVLKSDPEKINPLTPVDLVIDHSVAVQPGLSLPVRRMPITSGISMDMGCPSLAASASMPPTPQPSTPSPLIMVVCESVPTSVSG